MISVTELLEECTRVCAYVIACGHCTDDQALTWLVTERMVSCSDARIIIRFAEDRGYLVTTGLQDYDFPDKGLVVPMDVISNVLEATARLALAQALPACNMG